MVEGEEGNSVSQSVEKFIKCELLASQHRPENTAGSPDRIFDNFLEFTIKELIQKEAWKKGKMQVRERLMYFNQDYASVK